MLGGMLEETTRLTLYTQDDQICFTLHFERMKRRSSRSQVLLVVESLYSRRSHGVTLQRGTANLGTGHTNADTKHKRYLAERFPNGLYLLVSGVAHSLGG